jgi:hypothetical protein
MYFVTKSYLKSNCNHTAKHTFKWKESLIMELQAQPASPAMKPNLWQDDRFLFFLIHFFSQFYLVPIN